MKKEFSTLRIKKIILDTSLFLFLFAKTCGILLKSYNHFFFDSNLVLKSINYLQYSIILIYPLLFEFRMKLRTLTSLYFIYLFFVFSSFSDLINLHKEFLLFSLEIIIILNYLSKYSFTKIAPILILNFIIFIGLLIKLVFFDVGYEKVFISGLREHNYYASILFLYSLVIFIGNRSLNWITYISIILLIVLKSRTGILAVVVGIFLANSNKPLKYIIASSIVGSYLFGISDFLIEKWKNQIDWGNGNIYEFNRIELWKMYLEAKTKTGIQFLFPQVLVEYTYPFEKMEFLPQLRARFALPHNLFIQLFFNGGFIISLIFLVLLLAKLFRQNRKFRGLIIGLLIYGCLEPSIGPTNNLISLTFFILLLQNDNNHNH